MNKRLRLQTQRATRWLLQLLVLCTVALLVAGATSAVQAAAPSAATRFYVHLPFLSRGHICQPIPGAQYTTLSAYPPGPHVPAEVHADLDLAAHGYALTNAPMVLIAVTAKRYPLAFGVPGLRAHPAAV